MQVLPRVQEVREGQVFCATGRLYGLRPGRAGPPLLFLLLLAFSGLNLLLLSWCLQRGLLVGLGLVGLLRQVTALVAVAAAHVVVVVLGVGGGLGVRRHLRSGPDFCRVHPLD